ncbi:MAG: hypothetical protein JO250_22685 [Armatimonadetes bacterium]|nr:hypothetical protein [Armatimonadota bacterium]
MPSPRPLRLILGLMLLLVLGGASVFLVFDLRGWRGGFDMDRMTTGRNGLPRLSGPTNPGGPTYGESERADLEITDFGWNFLGPDSNPHQQTWAYAAVLNKSARPWRGVAVLLRLDDRQGNMLSNTAIPIGTLAPGQTRKAQVAVLDPRVYYSSVTGITGR